MNRIFGLYPVLQQVVLPLCTLVSINTCKHAMPMLHSGSLLRL